MFRSNVYFFILAVCIAGGAGPSLAGSFHFGETRYFPRQYSKPILETKKDGRKTYVPSVPTEYEKYHFGVGGETSHIGVTGTKIEVRSRRPGINLRLKETGHVVTVHQGEIFQVGDKRYKMLGVWETGIEYRDLDSGEIRRRRR